MADKAKPQPKLEKLKALADDPTEQAAYALTLLESEKSRQVVEAALAILEENVPASAWSVLSNLYQYYNQDGTKRDAGLFLRLTILKSLRSIALPNDVPLFEQMVSTYEFMPPTREEVAGGLRANALLALHELDKELAAYYGVRLLVDKYTSKMSGEPAVTAVRVLAALGQILPIYQYVLEPKDKIPEVTAECLKSLTALPLTFVQPLIRQYSFAEDDAVLLGLFDLIVAHPEGATFTEFLLEFLANTRRTDLYRYLVFAIITSRKKELISTLLDSAREETNRAKLQVLVEVLGLSKEYATDLALINKKLKPK